MRRSIFLTILLLGTAAAARPARATPLTLEELDRLALSLECSKECRAGKVALLSQCLLDKGCPGTDPNWEKNNQSPVDETDLELAIAEYWDAGAQESICYIDGAVVPAARCGRAHCLQSHSASMRRRGRRRLVSVAGGQDRHQRYRMHSSCAT